MTGKHRVFVAVVTALAALTGLALSALTLGMLTASPAHADSDAGGPLRYRSHVQNVGWIWTESVTPHATGTKGQSLRMEALEVWGPMLKNVQIRAHVQNVGWQEWRGAAYDRDDPEDFDPFIQVGTTGKGLRMEALQFRSTDGTRIECQAHVQGLGWMPWTTGECGTTGRSLRIEAVRLRTAA